MSIQSDVELLSIMTMEKYAQVHGLTNEQVMNVFNDNHVMEKIVLQHEYLHQIGFEEIMGFVESIITEDSHSLFVYHGTVSDFMSIDLQKSHDRRDFGKGFYTTLLEKQSKEWGYRLSLRTREKSYYVYKYEFIPNDDLKIKRFNTLSKDWLEFIKNNRIKGGLQHTYDVVIGPVADDNTMETVQLYMTGILKANEAVERLRYNKVNNQISFHTLAGIKALRFVERKIYHD